MKDLGHQTFPWFEGSHIQERNLSYQSKYTKESITLAQLKRLYLLTLLR